MSTHLNTEAWPPWDLPPWTRGPRHRSDRRGLMGLMWARSPGYRGRRYGLCHFVFAGSVSLMVLAMGVIYRVNKLLDELATVLSVIILS